jgi:hypothetical protein
MYREHQVEIDKRNLQISDEVLEVICGTSRGQAMVLLADEMKRRKKRARR